jgi:iron complex outermembrane receptor protein
LQDEIAIRPESLYLTLGAKLEHSDFGRLALQPSLRIAWVATSHTTIWSSFSVAERTPSFSDVAVRSTQLASPGPDGLPILVTIFSNPKEENEDLLATELGVRREFVKRLSLDVTTFFNRYNELRSTEPAAPFFESTPPPLHLVAPLVFANLLYGETHGGEAAISWKVSNRWTLSTGYAFLGMHLHPRPTSQDVGSRSVEGNSPVNQAQIRSHWVLPAHFQFDASAFFVGRLPSQNVPSYTRLDTVLTWQGGERFSLGLVGQNLLQDHHLETSNPDQIVQSSLIKRSAYAKIAWHF